MIRVIALCSSVFALSACATPPTVLDEVTPSIAARLLAGAYDNQDQFNAAPAEMKRAPAPGYPYDWIDVQHAKFQRVVAPNISDDAIYVEWRRADGSISRQRLWAFRTEATGGVRMDYFSFRTPEKFVAKGGQDPIFRTLRKEDLISYGPDCALKLDTRAPHEGWVGMIDEDSCQITGAASGRRMGLQVRLTVRPDGLSYEEAGILPDGGFAFKVPGGVAYQMQRRTPLQRSP